MQLDILIQLIRTMTLRQIRHALWLLEKDNNEAYLAFANVMNHVKENKDTEADEASSKDRA